MIYRFGDYEVDPASFRLLHNGTVVPLAPRIIDLLLFLVARPSVLVSKEDLFKALWPDVAVTDNALTQAVSELRQAAGGRSGQPGVRADRGPARLPLHRAGAPGRSAGREHCGE